MSRLDVGDGLELVLGLDEPERRLHLGLPRRVGAERPPLDRQAAPVELHQLGGHLAGRGTGLGPGPLPVGAAHLRERRRLAAAVGGDRLDLVHRQVEAVGAPVLQDQVVTGGPAHGPRRHALEAGDAVLAVDDEAPGLEVVEEPVRRPGPRAGPAVGHPPAGDVGLREHRHLGVGKDEPAGDGRGHHGDPGRAGRRFEHRARGRPPRPGRRTDAPRRAGVAAHSVTAYPSPTSRVTPAASRAGSPATGSKRRTVERRHRGALGDGGSAATRGRAVAQQALEGHVQAREALLRPPWPPTWPPASRPVPPPRRGAGRPGPGCGAARPTPPARPPPAGRAAPAPRGRGRGATTPCRRTVRRAARRSHTEVPQGRRVHERRRGGAELRGEDELPAPVEGDGAAGRATTAGR